MSLKIGADPEFFLKREDKFVSAFGMIPGTKQAPHTVPRGAVQVDGMALEFNIEPASTSKEFVYNIDEVLKHLRTMVPTEFDFAFESVAFFEAAYMKKQDPMAVMLGCDPDFNVYTNEANEVPDSEENFRTAAGHIHLGWYDKPQKEIDDKHIMECRIMAKQLDFMLGVPSLIFDSDNKRREMYGKAGTFRIKPYGMEYRVLSNFWLRSTELMSWVYTHTDKAFTLLVEDGVNLYDLMGDVAKDVIDTHNVDRAKYLLDHELNAYVDMEKVK